MEISKTESLLLVIYYLHKMEEGGFVESNEGVTLSEDGFDQAFDLIHKGAKISKDIMKEHLSIKEFNIPPNQLDGFILIMSEIQEKGLTQVLEETKNL